MAEQMTVEKAMEKVSEGRVFSGLKLDDVDDDAADKAAEEKAAEEAKKLAEEEAAKSAEAGSDETGSDEKPAETTTVKFKYASHEEAEKGYTEAEKRMREAIREAEAKAAEAETYKSQIMQYQNQLQAAEKSGELSKAEVKNLDNVFENMLTEINALDTDSDDYTKKLAGVWAKGVGTALNEYDQARDQKEAVRQKKQSESQVIEQQRQIAISKSHEIATKAGLDMTVVDDKPSIDYELYWDRAVHAQGETLEKRIDWTVNEVKRIKAEILKGVGASTAKAVEAQKKNQVLQKGVGAIPGAAKNEPPKPISISEALRRNERRI